MRATEKEYFRELFQISSFASTGWLVRWKRK